MNRLQRKLGFNFWALLLAVVLLPSCQQQINFPKPSLKSMSPTTKKAGDTAFTLTVMGKSFSPGAPVEWNGTPLVTTFLSTSEATTQVPAALIASPGTATVIVFTSTAGRRHIGHLSYFHDYACAQQCPDDHIDLADNSARRVVGRDPASHRHQFRSAIGCEREQHEPFYRLYKQHNPAGEPNGGRPGDGRHTIHSSDQSCSAAARAAERRNVQRLFLFNRESVSCDHDARAHQCGSGRDNSAVSHFDRHRFQCDFCDRDQRRTASDDVCEFHLTLTTLTRSGDIAAGGVDQIQVFNAAPGGGTSNIVVFSVNPTATKGLPVHTGLGSGWFASGERNLRHSFDVRERNSRRHDVRPFNEHERGDGCVRLHLK